MQQHTFVSYCNLKPQYIHAGAFASGPGAGICAFAGLINQLQGCRFDKTMAQKEKEHNFFIQLKHICCYIVYIPMLKTRKIIYS